MSSSGFPEHDSPPHEEKMENQSRRNSDSPSRRAGKMTAIQASLERDDRSIAEQSIPSTKAKQALPPPRLLQPTR
jgi:hypothetical protein